MALHCFLAHTSPLLAIEDGRLVLSTSFRGLAEGSEMARVSGLEQVPFTSMALGLLVWPKEKIYWVCLNQKISSSVEQCPICCGDSRESHWQGLGKKNCIMRPKIKASPSKAPPHGHRLSREPGTGLRTSSHHQDT